MLHFTLTGLYAGTVVCGERRDPMHDYMHSPSTSQLAKYLETHGVDNLCPQCFHQFLMTHTDNDADSPHEAEWADDTPLWVKQHAITNFEKLNKEKQ